MSRQAIRMDSAGRIAPLAGSREPRGYRRVLFLVHGFNNDELEASASFSKMRRSLDQVLKEAPVAEGIRRSLQEAIWEFYWPGFEPAVPSIQPTLRPQSALDHATTALAYDIQVDKVRRFVADKFSGYIRGLGAAEIFFIGHSLGCRVILETIKRVVASGAAIDVGGICLFAGAVPVHFLTRGAPLRGSADRTARKYCLYSHRDLVLSSSFPPGQIAAGEFPAYGWPVAIGLTGWPNEVWTVAKRTKFGHGGYWAKALKEPLDWRMTSVFSGMFGVTLSRRLAILGGQFWVSAHEWSLPEWRLRARDLAGNNWLEDLCAPLHG